MTSCDEALDHPPAPMPNVPVVLVVAAALIDQDGRVLMTERPTGKSFAGSWEFPGGKVEPGEIPEYALMRELAEELGIDTRPTCYYPLGFVSHHYPDMHLLMPLYACRSWRGTPVGQEGQAIKWVAPRALYNLSLVPADIELVAQVIDRI